jgi:hypothetical protein
MYINEETLELIVGLTVATENMTRDKLIFQSILESRVPSWREDYEKLKIDEQFQKRMAITLADIMETRRMLLQLLKSQRDGSAPPSIDEVQ